MTLAKRYWTLVRLVIGFKLVKGLVLFKQYNEDKNIEIFYIISNENIELWMFKVQIVIFSKAHFILKIK
jgi:hypothetical protein